MRQRCVLSLDILVLYSEIILRGIEHLKGINVDGKNINNIRFTEDTGLLVEKNENDKC